MCVSVITHIPRQHMSPVACQVVEKLYRLRWTRLDGLGGLILTPTRELAVQIFQELRKVGKYQELSAGLLIGGKGVKEEQERVARMNILVATPGRLLQHMDETPGFDTAQVGHWLGWGWPEHSGPGQRWARVQALPGPPQPALPPATACARTAAGSAAGT